MKVKCTVRVRRMVDIEVEIEDDVYQTLDEFDVERNIEEMIADGDVVLPDANSDTWENDDVDVSDIIPATKGS